MHNYIIQLSLRIYQIGFIKHFSFLITDKSFVFLNRSCLQFASTWDHTWFMVRSMMPFSLVFCVVYIFYFICLLVCLIAWVFSSVCSVYCVLFFLFSLDCPYVIVPSLLSYVRSMGCTLTTYATIKTSVQYLVYYGIHIHDL